MSIELPDFSVDLHEAARRSESETREWVAEKLDASIERYRRFFALARSGERVAPTRDIDMVWHLHMLSPVAYHHDCMAYLGRILDHDGGFGHLARRHGRRRDVRRSVMTAARASGIPRGEHASAGASVYESLFVGLTGRGPRR